MRGGVEVSKYLLVFFLMHLQVIHPVKAATPGCFKSLGIRHIKQKDGLSSAQVNCILKDAKGFLWFGTESGLNRYDGNNITIYNTSPGKNLADNQINDLHQDKQGNLWIGSDHGLALFDYSDQSFTHYYPSQPMDKHFFVKSIAEDKEGNLWLAAVTDIYKLDKEKNQLQLINLPDSMRQPGLLITELLFDRNGKLWLGAWNWGLAIVDFATGSWEKFSGINPEGTPFPLQPLITSMAEGPDGSIWLGTFKNGLLRVLPDRRSFNWYRHDVNNPNSINGNDVKSLHFDQRGFLWIGFEEYGLDRFSTEKNIFQHCLTDFLGYDVYEGIGVYSIFIDDESILWLGLRNDGVQLVPIYADQFLSYSNPVYPDYKVFSFAEGNNGLWIGVRGGIDYLYFPNRNFNEYYLPNGETPTALCQIADDRIFVGTYRGSLLEFNPYTRKFISLLSDSEKSKLNGRKITVLQHNSDDQLYIGAQNQFFQLDLTEKKLKLILNEWIHTIVPESAEKLWLFTFRNNRLFSFYPQTGKVETYNFKVEGGIKTGYPFEEEVYIGTDLGLFSYHLKKDSISTFSSIFPYQHFQVNAMERDFFDNLWFTADQAIILYDRDSRSFVSFDDEDGLFDIRFRDEISLRLNNGHIVFGGDGGLVKLDPGNFRNRKNLKRPVITKFLLNNQEVTPYLDQNILNQDITETSSIRLQHNQNVIAFEFSLLSYLNPGKHHFRYKLSDIQNEWVYLGNSNSVSFTNLNPGNYHLTIQGANEDNIWGPETSIAIQIMPPLWGTWYAYVFYFLMVLLLVFAVVQYRINRERLKNMVEMEQMKMTALQQNAEKESEFSQMRLQFFTNISHEFRTPLTLILAPLENFIKKGIIPGNEQMQMMYRNAERLYRLVSQVLDFRKIEAGRLKLEKSWGDVVKFAKETAQLFLPMAQQKNLDFHIQSSHTSFPAWFDQDKLEKIIYNLLANAFEYTSRGSVTFAVQITPGDNPHHYMMEICVADTGAGIESDKLQKVFDLYFHQTKGNLHKGTGIGLTMVKQLVELHGGSVAVSSEAEKGSEFRALIPLDTNYEGITESKVSTEALLPDENREQSAAESAQDKPLILLIEDNADLRNYISTDFSEYFEILEAENGQAGLQKTFAEIPDLIISDIMMPEMDGLEFCKTIKEDERTSHIPVILLTAYGSHIHQMQGYEIGADDYITKPFSPELLLQRVNNLLNSRRLLQEKYSQELRLQPKDLPVASMDGQFLHKAMQVIEKNLDNQDFNADQFASEMNMSRVHLYRKLKALTNQPISEFVKLARLKLAAELIKNRQMTIKEVAYSVGFRDPKYFSKCFKQQFGIKPVDYQNQL